MLDLVAQFEDLSPATVGDKFDAISTHAERADFLGKDVGGAPVFLIADDGSPNFRPPVRHQHLSASFGVKCRLSVDGIEQTGQFAVLRFIDGAHDLHELFIRCVQAALADLPAAVSGQEIEERVGSLLSLFQALSRPSSRELAGIWAELFCILNCGNSNTALHRWHADNFETHDFSWALERFEVKASVGQLRVHEFSLVQLSPPAGSHGSVASLLLRSTNNGLGVLDLAQAIEASPGVDAKLREKLWSQIIQALGRDFSDAVDKKFDPLYALENLVVFPMQDIPRLSDPEDSRITGIRFRVDLSGVQVLDCQKAKAALVATLGCDVDPRG